MRVTICTVGPLWLSELVLQLPSGATIEEAIAAARLQGIELPKDESPCGVWSRAKPRTWVLREGDRVEIYQPLKIDPKDARRSRAAGTRQDRGLNGA